MISPVFVQLFCLVPILSQSIIYFCIFAFLKLMMRTKKITLRYAGHFILSWLGTAASTRSERVFALLLLSRPFRRLRICSARVFHQPKGGCETAAFIQPVSARVYRYILYTHAVSIQYRHERIMYVYTSVGVGVPYCSCIYRCTIQRACSLTFHGKQSKEARRTDTNYLLLIALDHIHISY